MTSAALTEDEWGAVEAIRSGASPDAAARDLGVDERTFRRLLAVGADKLRMISSTKEDDRTSAADDQPSPRMVVPHLSPCPYCENFAGRPSPTSGPHAVIHEDEVVCVFLAPTALGGTRGHTLVTTKRHVETIFDLDRTEEASLASAVADTARMLRAAVDPEGLLVQQNNGVAAFQSVPHIHFHVIPKAAGPFPPVEPQPFIPSDDRAVLAAELRQHWRPE